MSNKQSTASYAFPLALGAGGSTAIALDHYLMRLTIGVGL